MLVNIVVWMNTQDAISCGLFAGHDLVLQSIMGLSGLKTVKILSTACRNLTHRGHQVTRVEMRLIIILLNTFQIR